MRAQGQAGLVRATQAGAASLSLNLTLPADSRTQALVPAGSPARAGTIPGGGSSTLAIGSSLSPQTRIYRQFFPFERYMSHKLLALLGFAAGKRSHLAALVSCTSEDLAICLNLASE